MLRVAVMLLLLVALIWVLLALLRAGRGAPATDARVLAVVDDVKELAWDHRELDPELAGEVISRLRAFDRQPRPDILDELLEVAWEHRERSPHLAEILISTIRSGGKGELT